MKLEIFFTIIMTFAAILTLTDRSLIQDWDKENSWSMPY